MISITQLRFADILKKLKTFPYLYLGLILMSGIYGCDFTKKDKKRPSETANKEKVIILDETLENKLIDQGLINIKDLDASIRVELKYSTTDNFFKKDVYGDLKNAYLQHEPALALQKANSSLKSFNKNYCLIIFDAARPLSIQKVLWNSLDSIPPKLRKNYVSDPSEGSIHNYGCAVDLSIFDISKNQELNMGTKFDYFGSLAYPRLETEMLKEGKLLKQQVENRKMLRKVMIQSGFQPITSEWWHFNYHSRQTAKKLYQIVE